MYRSIKYLGLALVMLLGLYPIAELTRVIVVSGTYYFPDMKGQFAAEIIVMWLLYLMIAPVYLMIVNRRFKLFRKFRKETAKSRISNENGALLLDHKEGYIRVDYTP
jgi:hypothetical protein